MSLADITKYMSNQLQRVNSCVAWVISEWLYCYEFYIKNIKTGVTLDRNLFAVGLNLFFSYTILRNCEEIVYVKGKI